MPFSRLLDIAQVLDITGECDRLTEDIYRKRVEKNGSLFNQGLTFLVGYKCPHCRQEVTY